MLRQVKCKGYSCALSEARISDLHFHAATSATCVNRSLPALSWADQMGRLIHHRFGRRGITRNEFDSSKLMEHSISEVQQVQTESAHRIGLIACVANRWRQRIAEASVPVPPASEASQELLVIPSRSSLRSAAATTKVALALSTI